MGMILKNQMQWLVYTQNIPKQEAKCTSGLQMSKESANDWKQRRAVQNRGKQNRLESYLSQEESGWVGLRIFFFLAPPSAPSLHQPALPRLPFSSLSSLASLTNSAVHPLASMGRHLPCCYMSHAVGIHA